MIYRAKLNIKVPDAEKTAQRHALVVGIIHRLGGRYDSGTKSNKTPGKYVVGVFRDVATAKQCRNEARVALRTAGET
jgi:hypothetical protein